MSLGKLSLANSFNVLVPREISRAGFLALPIELAHAIVVSSLPQHHCDPFDHIRSVPDRGNADLAFDSYGVTRIW
ncbi:MAG: hypothetical protein ABI353_12310 [Isosphaeraceae bacterium]